MSVGLILLAAGSGQRFGGHTPKQFLSLNNAPLLIHSIKVAERLASIQELIVVVSADRITAVVRLLTRQRIRKPWTVVAGGSFRGASVKNGLSAFQSIPDIVLVHDTARPLVTKKIMSDVIDAARKFGVALAAWPLSDTLKSSGKQDVVKKTIPRDRLWLAQTPQGFRRDVAIQCLTHPSRKATDDVSLAEQRGYRVKLVKASPTNLKVTYPMDLKIASALMNL